MRLRLLGLLLLAVAVVPALAVAGRTSSGKLEAYLSGKSEAPAKGAPAGKGNAAITITGTRVCWKISVTGIGTPLAAHIHKGKAGVAGGVVVPLGAKYKAKGCIATTPAFAKGIATHPGNYYVNVHTAKYPNGAVRGQLKAGDEDY